MDLFAFNLLFVLLLYTGTSIEQDVLPHGPVDVICGKSVTLKVLYEKEEDDDIIWNYSDGTDTINVATYRRGRLTVSDAYKCRASINTSNGYLTLSFTRFEDNGHFSITILTSSGTKTGEIQLRVLPPTTRIPSTSLVPSSAEQCSDYFVPMVVCLVVIILLSAGCLLLLYIWLNSKKSKAANDIEMQGTLNKVSQHEDSTYQALSSMDHEQTYSTLH